MSQKTDGTHAKNIANFAALIDMINSLGSVYQPANPYITLPVLQTLLNEATNAQNAINHARSGYSDAVDKQQLEFENLSKLTTNVANAFKASGASVKAQETLKTVTRSVPPKAKPRRLPLPLPAIPHPKPAIPIPYL